jgi:flagellar secretion chaperone FliS
MQSFTARDHYLSTEVATATPQKLHLLLIDAALTSANRARQFWHDGREDRAILALVHAQEVVGQILADIDIEKAGDLGHRLSTVYEFIFRRLVGAGARRDEKELGDAIRILEIERDTWRLICDKLAAATPESSGSGFSLRVPPPLHASTDFVSHSDGFSIEA